MSDFTYEIKESFGVVSESETGWTKELKMISWNNNIPKYDIRDWSPDGKKMGKGITLNKQEMLNLKDLIQKIEI